MVAQQLVNKNTKQTKQSKAKVTKLIGNQVYSRNDSRSVNDQM